MPINPGWLALIGAILGGSGLKIIEYWLGRSKMRDDIAAGLRNELRVEVSELRKELHQVESDLDDWRSKYYTLLEQFLSVKGQLEELKRQFGLQT